MQTKKQDAASRLFSIIIGSLPNTLDTSAKTQRTPLQLKIHLTPSPPPAPQHLNNKELS